MVAWGNSIALTYGDPTLFTMDHNNGVSFYSHTNVNQNFSLCSNCAAREPHVVMYGNDVYVTWEDNSLGKYQAFIKSSSDGGNSFGTTVDLSKGTNGGSWLPQFVATGNSVYVVWGQISGAKQFQLYFAYSHDSGATFSKAIKLSNDAGNAKTALVDANGNQVLVLWLDTTVDSSGQPVADYSTDGGVTFSSQIPLNNNLGKYVQQENDSPEITHNGNVFFATWLDTASTSGKAETFFTSGTLGGSSSGTQLTTSQTDVQPGSIVTLTGTGYQANSQVSFTFAGVPFGGSFPTDSTGGFTVQVQIPTTTSAGTYYFTATDLLGNTASAEEVVS